MIKGNHFASFVQCGDNPLLYLNVAHKSEKPKLSHHEASYKNLSKKQADQIAFRIEQGESPELLTEVLGLSIDHIYQIAYSRGIRISDSRPWSDPDIIFGFKGICSSKTKGFEEYDQQTKDNYSFLIKKHEYLINWRVNLLARGKFNGRIDLEELKQIVLCFSYYNYKSYSPHKCAFSTWLITLTDSVIGQYFKRLYNRFKVFDTTEFNAEIFDEEDVTYNEESYSLKLLRRAIKELPERQKQIITLHLDGYSNAAIAAQIRVSTNTVQDYLCDIKHSIKAYSLTGQHLKLKQAGKLEDGKRIGRGGNYKAKGVLPDETILSIKDRIQEGAKLLDIAAEFHVMPQLISKIKRGIAYKSIGPDMSKVGSNKFTRNKRLSESDKSLITNLLSTMKLKDIAERFGVSQPAISYIAKKYKSNAY